VGPEGRVAGVDFTDQQIAKARRLRDRDRFTHVDFVEASIDVVGAGFRVTQARPNDYAFSPRRRTCKPSAAPDSRQESARSARMTILHGGLFSVVL
jgi:hypothetical protein